MAVYFIFNSSTTGLAIALIAAALFDMLDGWAARKLGTSSELGKQLDSLPTSFPLVLPLRIFMVKYFGRLRQSTPALGHARGYHRYCC